MPAAPTSAGLEAVELAADAGLILDEWQKTALIDSLGERPDGKWAATEVGLIVPRQDGKGSILEARELAGLYLFGEQLILHSAHEFKTSAEGFRRIWTLIQNTPDLERRVMRVATSHGSEGIELIGGQRLRFVARSTGSGRGFSGDTVILDEAYNLPAEMLEALVPTMAARPNAQLWYTSSAPLPGERSAMLRKLCKRGRGGDSARLAYLEWCAPDEAWDDLDNPEYCAAANPGLGIRITTEFIEQERAILTDEGFARERLGLWKDEDDQPSVIPAEDWASCLDPDSQIVGPMCFAFDVTPDRQWSTVAACGKRADSIPQVESIDHRRGTSWVTDRLVELVRTWKPPVLALDPAGPAGGLLADLTAKLENAGLIGKGKTELAVYSTREAVQACGQFFDFVTDGAQLRHLGQLELDAAVEIADKRNVGDAWMWDRKGEGTISPLVAVTLALWAHSQYRPPVVKPRVVDLAAALRRASQGG